MFLSVSSLDLHSWSAERYEMSHNRNVLHVFKTNGQFEHTVHTTVPKSQRELRVMCSAVFVTGELSECHQVFLWTSGRH